MTFVEFLTQKKIDVSSMRAALGAGFQSQEEAFDKLGAAAYDQRKKFFINDWRLRFPIKVQER